ncbi:MAG: tyrosine-type recombinase/integrase [Bacteroidota bacterium]
MMDAFIAYLQLEKQCAANTVKAYSNDVNAFKAYLEHAQVTLEVHEVDYDHIRAWVISLVEEGVSNRTVNRKIAALRSYYRFLQNIGEIEKNPLAKHRALKTEKKVQIPFSKNEMETVLEEIEYTADFSGLRDKLLIELLYATGIRRAELIGICLSDINVAGQTLKVHGKRNKERIVPLIPAVIQTLEAYLNLRGQAKNTQDIPYLLLTDSGHKLYETFVYRTINKYLSKASVKLKKSPHMMRHTFATHLLDMGADLNAVKELLGHASLASTQVYTHSSIAQLKKVHAAAHPRNKE